MKSFWVSMIMFCALLVMIILNCCYTVRACDELDCMIQALPNAENASQAVSELRDYWKQKSGGVSISTPLQIIQRVEDCFTELQYAADYGDARTFEKNRYLAKTLIQELRDRELPRLENWI